MKVGFAGAGNMAAAMARGWAGAEGGPETMVFCDLERGRAAGLAEELGGSIADDLSELAGQANLIVLAVKPAALDSVATELAPAGPEALLSVLAGTPLARIAEAFPGVPAVRLMPNQPVEVRRGVLCFARGEGVPDEIERAIVDVLELLGLAIELDEQHMEAAMAVMACSPAYVALVAEVLTDAGVREGLDPAIAARFVAETFAGTGELLAKRDPAEIRRAVAPPGGATEAGLEALERGALRAAFDAAAEASLARVRPADPGAKQRMGRPAHPDAKQRMGRSVSSSPLAAIGREDIADYVSALFLVYLILIFARIVLSFFPRLPYNPTLRTVVGFIHEVTDPYLNLFRRFIPPIGPLDLSPILAIFLLYIAQALVVGAIEG